MLYMNLPTEFTNIIFLRNCSGDFGTKRGFFRAASRLRGVRTLRDFDDRVTAYYCGFTGADDYYARSAAANVIDRVAKPTLVIHAVNDPFIRILPEIRHALISNPNITYIEVDDGGHCAFVGERVGDPIYAGRWAEREVVEFAKQFR
jgi:hypothetical protein